MGKRKKSLAELKEFLERVDDFLARAQDERLSELDADQADILSTFLEYVSRQYELGNSVLYQACKGARQVCEYGLLITEDEPLGGHSRPLLLLTYALLSLKDRQDAFYGEFDAILAEAIELAPCISSPNQRARVYRKIGAILLMKSWNPSGLIYLARALSVPGAATGTQLKTSAF